MKSNSIYLAMTMLSPGVSAGIAHMCNGSVPVSLPSPEEVENFQRTRRQLYEDQVRDT